MVPSLVLQPIVENAIRHGMADRPDVGHVTVSGRRRGDSLRLEVADDGPGLHSSPPGNGIGLANTRERLARLYGERGHLEMVEERGLTVRLTLPLRTS
jgi:LytS/YehU family sensor histidine kinase